MQKRHSLFLRVTLLCFLFETARKARALHERVVI